MTERRVERRRVRGIGGLEQDFKRYKKKNDYLMLILDFPSSNGTGV